jgi:hypothetical protein
VKLTWENPVDKGRIAGAIASGFALLLLSGIVLSWVYAWCMTDSSDPDYYYMKLRMMFGFPDPGIGTWLGIALFLSGSALITYGIAKAVQRMRLPSDY